MFDVIQRRLQGLAVRAHVRLVAAEEGQTSVEYALVLLGAAAIALLVGAWAGGTDKVGDLLDAVFDRVLRNSSK